MPQASASTQTLASPSETVGSTITSAAASRPGSAACGCDAEEADAVRQALRRRDRFEPGAVGAVADEDQGRAGDPRQRLEREILALAREQMADA